MAENDPSAKTATNCCCNDKASRKRVATHASWHSIAPSLCLCLFCATSVSGSTTSFLPCDHADLPDPVVLVLVAGAGPQFEGDPRAEQRQRCCCITRHILGISLVVLLLFSLGKAMGFASAIATQQVSGASAPLVPLFRAIQWHCNTATVRCCHSQS